MTDINKPAAASANPGESSPNVRTVSDVRRDQKSFQRDIPAKPQADLVTPEADTGDRGSDPQGGGKPPSKLPSPKKMLVIAVLFFAVVAALAFFTGGSDAPEEVSLNEVEQLIADGDVVKAWMNDSAQTIGVELEDGTKVVAGYPRTYGSDLYQELNDADIEVEITGLQRTSIFTSFMFAIFPILLIIGFMMLFLRKYMGGRMSAGGGRGDPVAVPNVLFSDVIGADEATEDLREVVDFLRDPDRYSELGATPPKGVLLVGPPGTGKTLLAKAAAGEAGVPFIAMSGSDFVEMFVGVGASRIRTAFDKARKLGRCIVFIDEFDAVGKTRGTMGGGANEERENTLNALLVEMDGFRDRSVVVIGATNRAETLDPALLRPGRFDRQVTVGAPDRKGRKQLYETYLSNVKLDNEVDLDQISESLAARSPGMTGADIRNVANEAALIAARLSSPHVSSEHIFEALERGALGRERRSMVVTEKARTITAYHEAGHAVCAMLQPEALRPQRVSIVPRGGAGGVTWFSGRDDEMFITKAQCVAELAVSYGGRAAEELILDGDYTQGAAGDIAQATARATKMVCEWGMSELGVVQLDPSRMMGESAERVRLEVASLCDQGLADARRLLREHNELFEAVAQALLEHETIDAEHLEELAAALR